MVYLRFHSLLWHEISTRAISDLHIIIKAARGFFQFEAIILYLMWALISSYVIAYNTFMGYFDLDSTVCSLTKTYLLQYIHASRYTNMPGVLLRMLFKVHSWKMHTKYWVNFSYHYHVWHIAILLIGVEENFDQSKSI